MQGGCSHGLGPTFSGRRRRGTVFPLRWRRRHINEGKFISVQAAEPHRSSCQLLSPAPSGPSLRALLSHGPQLCHTVIDSLKAQVETSHSFLIKFMLMSLVLVLVWENNFGSSYTMFTLQTMSSLTWINIPSLSQEGIWKNSTFWIFSI